MFYRVVSPIQHLTVIPYSDSSVRSMPIPHEEYKVAYVTSITDPGWWGTEAYVNAGTSFFFVFCFFPFFLFFKISDSAGTTPCTAWRCPCLQGGRSQSVLVHCKIMIGSVFTYKRFP